MSTQAKYEGEEEMMYNNRRQLMYDDRSTTGKKYTNGNIIIGSNQQHGTNNYTSSFNQV